MPLVDAGVWEQMEGDSEIEKRINSYLTQQFIVTDQVPSDECLREAQAIMNMVRKYYVA